MVGTMVECIRRNCTNEAIGGNSYKKSLCNPCRKRHSRGEELYVSCTICKKSIYIQNMSGGPRFTCSETCAKERVRNRNKERYDGKLANMKRCKRRLRVFCSVNCYNKNEYYRTLYKRAFNKSYKLVPLMIKVVLK
jgi:hypothetical protein